MKSFGWFFLAGAFYWATTSAGNFSWFIDSTSIIWIALTVMGGLWASFGPGPVYAAFESMLLNKPMDADQKRRFASVFRQGHQLSWGSGLIGMFIGLIVMLQNMDDPAAIGPGMAVALLVAFYGAILAEFLFGPLHYAIMNRTAIPHNTHDAEANEKTDEQKRAGKTDDDDELDKEHTRLNGKMTGIASAVIFLIVTSLFIVTLSVSEASNMDIWRIKSQQVKESFGPDGTGGDPSSELIDKLDAIKNINPDE